MTGVHERHPTNLEIAAAVAPGWERRRAFFEHVLTPVRGWLLRALGPRPGATVLELAAGPGDSGFDAADLIGARGRLICSDLSPAMLDVARRRGRERGIENVDYRVLDAERIALPDDAVDAVLCRFGYIVMHEPGAALAETRRVLRAGGRMALAAWGAPARNPFFTLAPAALVAAGHLPPPEPSGPGPFSMADAARLERLVADAGFDHVRTDHVPVTFLVRDVDDYLAIVADTAGPLALVLARLDAGERRALAARIEPALAPFRVAAGCALPGVAVCAVAR